MIGADPGNPTAVRFAMQFAFPIMRIVGGIMTSGWICAWQSHGGPTGRTHDRETPVLGPVNRGSLRWAAPSGTTAPKCGWTTTRTGRTADYRKLPLPNNKNGAFPMGNICFTAYVRGDVGDSRPLAAPFRHAVPASKAPWRAVGPTLGGSRSRQDPSDYGPSWEGPTRNEFPINRLISCSSGRLACIQSAFETVTCARAGCLGAGGPLS